uniref:hypothetical protein n=1 Tax=Sphingomonas populi TaxID=2484750 RepID=UPI001E322000|nr:hypothetical protein [Sphingomonas populi]
MIEAFNGGSLDFGGMSEIPPIFAAASNIHSFRQIAVQHGDVNNRVVLVPFDTRPRYALRATRPLLRANGDLGQTSVAPPLNSRSTLP